MRSNSRADQPASEIADAQAEQACVAPRVTRVPLAYCAGPYRAATTWLVEQNIRAAEALGYRIAQLGAYPIIPHSNTRGFFESAAGDDLWLAGTLELMRRCDCVVLLPTWRESSGARAEQAEAERLGLKVFSIGQLQFDEFERWVADFAEARNAAE
jgi:hypothetical protein